MAQPNAGAAPARADTTKAAVGGGLAACAAACLAFAVAGLKPDEGLALTDYLDLAKVPTACFGHTGADVRVGQRRTLPECEAMLAKDVQREQLGVTKCVPALATRPYQWAASTRLAHNIGVAGFCGSGAAIHFRRGDWRGGCDLFLPWDKARVNGKLVRVAGLAARRRRERAQCLTGVAV
jgi:lysozyme